MTGKIPEKLRKQLSKNIIRLEAISILFLIILSPH